MSDKTLWGIPIVETDAMPEGEIVFGPMPTADDVMRYGSFENAVQAMKDEYCKRKLDDAVLAADEIE